MSESRRPPESATFESVERPIRISDDDRERYTATLRTAYAEGRIDDVELEERLTAVLEARYEADLLPVVADLPHRPSPLTPVRAGRPLDDVREIDDDDEHDDDDGSFSPFLMAPVICTAIYAMTDLGGYFWPMWVWFGCSIPVVGSLVSRRFDR